MSKAWPVHRDGRLGARPRGYCGDGGGCDGELSRIQRPIAHYGYGFERTDGRANERCGGQRFDGHSRGGCSNRIELWFAASVSRVSVRYLAGAPTSLYRRLERRRHVRLYVGMFDA